MLSCKFEVLSLIKPKKIISLRNLSHKNNIQEVLKNLIPAKREELKELKSKFGKKSLGELNVEQCLGGARGVKCILWETSLLDPEVGIRFRGYTIPEIQQKLPKYKHNTNKYTQPLPEALTWLLLTGDIPTQEQAESLTEEFHSRSRLPQHVINMIDNFPKNMHPMTQFSAAVSAMNTESLFVKKYEEGVSKNDFWISTLEDCLNLIANAPEIAARIYRNTFFDGKRAASYDNTLDYSANFCRMLGYTNEEFDELMRLYISIHSDHEGGNASAHTTRLVSSTLSDAYISVAAGLNALAGPLHGLANQEVLRWIQKLQAEFKFNNLPINQSTIKSFVSKTLDDGKVVPGFGHAVLKITDPRYTCQREFALKYLPDDELFEIVNVMYQVIPGMLKDHGKVRNPYPNVDSHSGVLLHHYGFTQMNFFTVLFGVSRILGVCSQLFWDRALGLPIERPKSVTSKWIKDYCSKA